MEIWLRTPGEVTGEIFQRDALPATLATTGRCRVALRRGSKCPSFTRKHTRCTIVASLAVACSMAGHTGQARSAPESGVHLSADGQRLSLDLEESPLHQVLKQIATGAGFVLKYEGDLNEPVTVRLNGVPIPRALSILLGKRSHVTWFHPGRAPGVPPQISMLLVIDRHDGSQYVTFRPAPLVPSPPDLQAPADASIAEPSSEEAHAHHNEELRAIARAARATHSEAVTMLDFELRTAESPHAREAAIGALGQIGTMDAVRTLRSALDDPEPSVRYKALRELGAARGQSAVASLRRVLRSHHDPSDRLHAARHLASHRMAQARHGLAVALEDPDPEVRAAAQDSLALLASGRPRAAPAGRETTPRRAR